MSNNIVDNIFLEIYTNFMMLQSFMSHYLSILRNDSKIAHHRDIWDPHKS